MGYNEFLQSKLSEAEKHLSRCCEKISQITTFLPNLEFYKCRLAEIHLAAYKPEQAAALLDDLDSRRSAISAAVISVVPSRGTNRHLTGCSVPLESMNLKV